MCVQVQRQNDTFKLWSNKLWLRQFLQTRLGPDSDLVKLREAPTQEEEEEELEVKQEKLEQEKVEEQEKEEQEKVDEEQVEEQEKVDEEQVELEEHLEEEELSLVLLNEIFSLSRFEAVRVKQFHISSFKITPLKLHCGTLVERQSPDVSTETSSRTSTRKEREDLLPLQSDQSEARFCLFWSNTFYVSLFAVNISVIKFYSSAEKI
ncbi:histone H3.v1-like [Boleophthalmus pectinirostris]|uniref:histone H3.v1-like n=1 Tax=Boleophthalmus pectinirostris TaxID=150288 RepID=UPI0024316A35|nr:histone H3.v1-like [Boleophthalmus pectinirostris]